MDKGFSPFRLVFVFNEKNAEGTLPLRGCLFLQQGRDGRIVERAGVLGFDNVSAARLPFIGSPPLVTRGWTSRLIELRIAVSVVEAKASN